MRYRFWDKNTKTDSAFFDFAVGMCPYLVYNENRL